MHGGQTKKMLKGVDEGLFRLPTKLSTTRIQASYSQIIKNYLMKTLKGRLEETVEEFSKNGVDPLTVSLYQMDLDRTLFLLRSYLRTRLQKVENYAFHIHKNTDSWNRLSKQEQKFAERCISDMEQHLDQSVLSKLPNGFKSHLKQSSLSLADDMVPEPQLDQYVICRSKRNLGSFQLDESGEPVNIEANDLYALPYKSVKQLVVSGQIDLI
ncbi:unnamed protein product [Withania somnifera]